MIWKKYIKLTDWDERPFYFETVLSDSLEKIDVMKNRFITIVFDKKICISVGLNNRNPFIKQGRGVKVIDNWLYLGAENES